MKKKIFLIVVIAFIVLVNFCSISMAYVDIDDIVSNRPVSGADKIKKFGNNIYSVITVIGIAASVIVLMIIGMKYMMGSAEERAGYKKSLMPYFIGSILVFSASAIANIIYLAMYNPGGTP